MCLAAGLPLRGTRTHRLPPFTGQMRDRTARMHLSLATWERTEQVFPSHTLLAGPHSRYFVYMLGPKRTLPHAQREKTKQVEFNMERSLPQNLYSLFQNNSVAALDISDKCS